MYYVIILSLLQCVFGERYVLPTIFWHPQNPIFACKDPVLNVRYNDHVNFFCPNHEIQPSATLQKELLSESLYVVPNESDFSNCQAKDGVRYLRCDSNHTSGGQCKNGGIDCPHFYNMWFKTRDSPLEVNFVKGGDYYLIAPSYRTLENLDGVIGGSCNTVRNPTEYKMRLKIHICTDEEIAKGECERCLTEACYYKDCKKTCSAWQMKSKKIFQTKNGKCFQTYSRKCSTQLINSVNIETKNIEIDCPMLSCDTWKNNNKNIFSSGKCLQQQVRHCTDKKSGLTFNEKQSIELTCPQTVCTEWKKEDFKRYKTDSECFVPFQRDCIFPWINISVKERKEEKEDCLNSTAVSQPLTSNGPVRMSFIKYAAIFSSILSFVLGITIGCLCKKYRYHRLKLRQQDQVDMPAQIIANEALFDTIRKSSSGDGPIFVVGTIDRNAAKQNRKPRSSSLNTSNDSIYYPCTVATLPRTNQGPRASRLSSSNSQVLLLRPMNSVSTLQRRNRSESDVISEYPSSSASSSFKSDVFMEEF